MIKIHPIKAETIGRSNQIEFPTSEQIERICISVNTICNLGCTYCYFFHPENRVEKEKALSGDEIFEILENAISYHRRHKFPKKIKVNFVGSGEPLIHWKNIQAGLLKFNYAYPLQQSLKFYTVTNATLLTNKMARDLLELNIIPSVSLDGPKMIHDHYRVDHKGQGSFDRVMQGIQALQDVGFEITINTTLTRDLLNNLDEYVQFITQEKFKKIVFDRLVDSSDAREAISYSEYYSFLQDIHSRFKNSGLDHVEIGNLEAYKRNFSRKPDKVCTMFGGSCGAGSNFVIYMGRDVYPCGRMFGKSEWLLGTKGDALESFQANMEKHWPERDDCKSCSVFKDCVRDCLLEFHSTNYSCDSRKSFLNTMKGVL